MPKMELPGCYGAEVEENAKMEFPPPSWRSSTRVQVKRAEMPADEVLRMQEPDTPPPMPPPKL